MAVNVEFFPVDNPFKVCFFSISVVWYTVCKDREWGLGCKFKCINCETDCDKFTGACKRCLPGYQDTNNSCNRREFV